MAEEKMDRLIANGSDGINVSIGGSVSGMNSAPDAEQDAIAPPSPLDNLLELPPTYLPPVKTKSWRWLLFGLSSCGVFLIMAASALISLWSLPPAPDCQKLSPMSPDMERLYCAQEAARSGKLPDLLAGLDLAAQWTPDHPLHNEASRWVDEWSETVLKIARQKIDQNDLQGAVAIATRIPKTSEIYPDAQEAIKAWKGQWQEGETLFKQARQAMQQQQWEVAAEQIRLMNEMEHEHWNAERANELTQQMVLEKRARQSLAQARQLVQEGTPEKLGTALTLVSQVNYNTFAWAEVQPELSQWSNTLLTNGFQQWQGMQLDQAIATAKTVQQNPKAAAEAQNLIKLSEARQMAASTALSWVPTPDHAFKLSEAIAAARQIPADSRFYSAAQTSLVSWQAQLEDVLKLQYAQVTASLGQPETLKLAVVQAEQIAPGRPRRAQAQTLIAHWKREIERLEDRPYLVQANKLAVPGTIPALRAAIAQASQVKMGRALRGEAQGLIYVWNQQIQTLEDQPFLDMARVLARRGKLNDAIQNAELILPGRALYPSAQTAIRSWRSQIYRAEQARRQAAQRALEAERALQRPPSPTATPTNLEGKTVAPPAARRPVREVPPAVVEPAPSVEAAPTPPPEPAPPPTPVQEAPSPTVEAAPPPIPEPAPPPRVETPAPTSEVPTSANDFPRPTQALAGAERQ